MQMLDQEGYPCSGHDCYKRGNFQKSCKTCQFLYSTNNPPKDEIRSKPQPEYQFWEG